MVYNLTESQKDLARWIVKEVRAARLPEEFTVFWGERRTYIMDYSSEHPEITAGALDALTDSGLILRKVHHDIRGPRTISCTLMGKAYEAVDSDFDAPDTSFVKHLTPLADVTNLDADLKQRCLPILSAGSADPMIWDSAVRTVGVILEERLRGVAGITDASKIGRPLVNSVFGPKGLLAGKFSNDSERDGYRELYAGMVGVFRNPSAHTFVDPTPEDGGAFIVFVNLLLKRLEDLR